MDTLPKISEARKEELKEFVVHSTAMAYTRKSLERDQAITLYQTDPFFYSIANLTFNLLISILEKKE